MTQRFVQTEHDREMLLRFIKSYGLPFTATVTEGGKRTDEQNRLLYKWYGEISEQLGDMTVADVRKQVKLEIGVPILRAHNEHFRDVYDKNLKHLPYEEKLKLMEFIPVTSMMKVKELTQCLDHIYKRYTSQGIFLTVPDESAPDSSSPGALSGRESPSAETGSRGSPSRATGANQYERT